MQTIIGLLGFWVAGTEVKSIIKGSFTGMSEVRATSAMIRTKGDHPATTPSCFRLYGPLQYPNAVQLHARPGLRRQRRTRHG